MLNLLSKVTIIKVEKGGFVDSWLSGSFYDWFASYIGYLWLIIALAFLFAELNTPGLFFFISFAIGSIVAAIVSFLGYSIIVQCLAGLFVAVTSFLLMRKYLKKKEMSRVIYDKAKTNVEALVGSVGIVTEEIKPHGVGTVKIGGEKWRAKGEAEAVLQSGTIVSVLRVEGNTVIVKPAKMGD